MRLLALTLLAACADPTTGAPHADVHGDPHPIPQTGPGAAPLPPPLPSSCTSADLVGLSPTDLVDYLGQHDSDCLYFLWTFDAAVQATLTSDPHVEAVLNNIAARAPAWAGPDVDHLEQKLLLARIRYYHAFYSAPAFVGRDVAAETTAALAAVDANPHLLDPTDDAEGVLYEWINLADGSDKLADHVDQLTEVLRAWTGPRLTDYGAQLAVYGVAVTTARQLWNANPAFLSAVDLDLLDAVDDAISAGLAGGAPVWVTNNLMWTLGHFALAPSLYAEAVARLTSWYQSLPLDAEAWLWAVAAIDDFASCQTSVPGLTVCRDDVVPQLEATLFPHDWSFDDGALRIRTALDEATARRLYHAITQVQAHTDRRLRRMAPLLGDPNPTLTLVVYASPTQYQAYQPFLYGLSANNGGIYIEDAGTLYTYDRTPADSIFTLEELVRHEMTHAALGRWLVDGLWGVSPIYADNRMVFFDEGMAEHLAGATAADGIPARAALVDQVAADGANRMHVASIVRATYGDFRFYPYAGLLFSYLDAREPGRLLALIDVVAAGDVAGFDAWVSAAASDAALDAAYQTWLDDLVAGRVPSVDPATPAFPVDPFSVVSVGVVRDVVRTSPWGAGAACVISERASLGRWTCRGSWTGPRLAPDLPGTWAALDARADQLTADIEATIRRRGAGLPRNGNTLFGTVCRTGAVTLLGANNMLGEWSCSGTLRPQPAAAQTDLQRLTADLTAAGMGAPACAAGPDRCDLTLTTSAFPRGAADATLAAELGLRARVVADRVFTRGRGFHATTACALTGPMTTQLVGGLRTGTQTLRCTHQP